ncbi:hypothetical protein Lalb_Chr11g0062281 [Lupinus albus]|uniref:Uncharacterized protein n=1 Tax=Lupinus albus TaxID=3870 RepID=A0A6A4PPZ7_LUPAL|nr:hypothetical protein Lalb_Chr11g0062281 [Lupinus albus]
MSTSKMHKTSFTSHFYLHNLGFQQKHFGSNSAPRDRFFDTVYSAIYSSTIDGGAAVGG